MSAKRIILTGGGTGGHITPLLAVAHELKKIDPDCYIIYIGERNGKYASMLTGNTEINEVHSIFAGKFRRYHRESWLRRALAVRTNLLNLRDFIYFVLGTIQSMVLIRRLKPDSVLLKGGFVGVPVGLASAFWRKKIITHDSDTMPGLANRLVSRWAKFHATGMPPEYYNYPAKSMRYVGVLVGSDYQAVTPEQQIKFKEELGLSSDNRVVLVTGGSGGSANINKAVRAILPKLFEAYPDLYLIHQVGIGKGGIYEGYSHDRLQVYELLKPMYKYTGASDAVITRAGANTMAELGIQGKACVVIPNPLLTGGHQLKNGEFLASKEAALIIDEKNMKQDANVLFEAVCKLLDDDELRRKFGSNLQVLAVPDAAHKLAGLLLDQDFADDIPA